MSEPLTKHTGHLVEVRPDGIDRKRFHTAPCYLCGYNGHGYFQPQTHPCAAVFHDQLEWDSTVNVAALPPAQDWYKASEVEALLNDLTRKWAAQTGAREGVSFRLAMKSIQDMLDQLRKGKE